MFFFFLARPPPTRFTRYTNNPAARIIIQRLVYFGHRIRSSPYASDRPYPLLFCNQHWKKKNLPKNHQKKKKKDKSSVVDYRRLELYCDLLVFLVFFSRPAIGLKHLRLFAAQPDSRQQNTSESPYRTVRAPISCKREKETRASAPFHRTPSGRAVPSARFDWIRP